MLVYAIINDYSSILPVLNAKIGGFRL